VEGVLTLPKKARRKGTRSEERRVGLTRCWPSRAGGTVRQGPSRVRTEPPFLIVSTSDIPSEWYADFTSNKAERTLRSRDALTHASAPRPDP